jgi:hypothetical protein
MIPHPNATLSWPESRPEPKRLPLVSPQPSYQSISLISLANPVVTGDSGTPAFGSRSFLVTAAHVMDDAKGPGFYVGGDSTIVGISAPYHITAAPGSPRENDRIDLALVLGWSYLGTFRLE